MKLLIPIFFIFSSLIYAQRVTYISSDILSEKFPEVNEAEEIIQLKVNQWKKELENYQIKIDNIELNIKQNKSKWTDLELKDRHVELFLLKEEKVGFASTCFEVGGKFDKLVKDVWEPIEVKIFNKTNDKLDTLKSGK